MDKQLIERIALEVAANVMGLEGDEAFIEATPEEIVSICTSFLSRIDAERSKKAAAWFINVNDECDPDHPLYQQISKGFEGCLGTFPLFRSPTIPEGMAQDAERYRFIRMNRLWLKANLPLIAAPAFDKAIDAGLLAAAQGERNGS